MAVRLTQARKPAAPARSRSAAICTEAQPVNRPRAPKVAPPAHPRTPRAGRPRETRTPAGLLPVQAPATTADRVLAKATVTAVACASRVKTAARAASPPIART